MYSLLDFLSTVRRRNRIRRWMTGERKSSGDGVNMSNKTHYGGGFPAGPRGAERAKRLSGLGLRFCWAALRHLEGRVQFLRKLCVIEWARMAQGANLFVHLRLTGRSGSARQPKTAPADVGLRKSFVRSTIVGKLAGLFERVRLVTPYTLSTGLKPR